MEDLAIVLGRQHQMPAALQEHFNHLDQALVARLSPELAASWHAVPLGRTASGGVAIATTDPFTEDVLYELENLFEAEIVQAISPELRMLYWLEQVYQIERINRYKRTYRDTGSFDREKTDPERRGYIKTLSDCDSVNEISPLARVAVKRMAVPLSGELQLPADPDNLDDCCRAIRQATGAGRMADIVANILEHGFHGVFAAGMLLTVRDELAIGWRGFVRGQPDKGVEVLAVPLSVDSIFVGPSQRAESYFGLPAKASVVDKRLWQFLGSPPQEVAILPVEAQDKVVCLLYVQCAGPIPADFVGSLAELSRALSGGLTRLIRDASR